MKRILILLLASAAAAFSWNKASAETEFSAGIESSAETRTPAESESPAGSRTSSGAESSAANKTSSPGTTASVKAPRIGAQIFIEPGQTPEDIELLFSRMEEAGMGVGRIRLFGSHVSEKGGYELYDCAFDAAARHGVRLFVTLFPETDELSDVGGFKFPETKEQLAAIRDYVTRSVTRYRNHPALDSWVLQNEPGLGGTVDTETPLAAAAYKDFCARHPYVRDGFLKADFRPEQFTREYTAWYLGEIADMVKRLDPGHGRHINPHQILRTLPEYDFPALDGAITSLGSSMHLSWHFGDFTRTRYPVGIALMSDIIRSAAGSKDAWVTEMQGGPVTASGKAVLCPTPAEMEQNILTAIFSGMDGVMFWTLNPRRAVQEAGEWSLLDFTMQPSARMRAASKVIADIRKDADFYAEAKPCKSPVCIVYNKESFWIQHRNAVISGDSVNPGRGPQAVAQSMAASYAALSSLGLSPVVGTIGTVPLDSFKCVVVPDMVSLSRDELKALESFARRGGTVVLTGMSGYYDHDMRCNFMEKDQGGFSFTGARIKEFAVREDWHTVSEAGLWNHFWMGTLELCGARSLLTDGGECIASVADCGTGKVIWFPSMVDIGAWHAPSGAITKLAAFYSGTIGTVQDIRFDSPLENVFLRILATDTQKRMLLVNRNRYPVKVNLLTPEGKRSIVLEADTARIVRP